MEYTKNRDDIVSQTMLSNLIVILSIITFISYISNLYCVLNSNIDNEVTVFTYIKLFSIILNAVCVGSGIVCYMSSKREELFFMSLVYIIFTTNILFMGSISDFDSLLGNYTNTAISIMAMLLCLIMIKDNKIKRYMIKNKIKSTLIIFISASFFFYLQYKTNIDMYFDNIGYIMIFNFIKFSIYFFISIILLRRCYDEKDYIYGVIGFSTLMFSTKVVFNMFNNYLEVGNLNMITLSINYITVTIFLGGLFIEFINSMNISNKLIEKNHLFVKIFEENRHSNVMVTDMNHNIIYANDKFYKEYKSLIDKAIDKYGNINTVTLNEYKDTDIIKNKLRKEKYFNDVLNIEEEDKVIDLTIQIFKYNNNEYIIIEFRDITENHKVQKTILEIENMKKEEKIRSEFFANVSHELKTPLNIIYSTFQLLDFSVERNDIKDTYKRYRNTLDMNCKRMLRLIDNIVDVSRLEVGCTIFKFKNFDVVRLIEDITLSVVNYAKCKYIEIIFDTDVEELDIKLDIYVMERVMLNLLSNAIKFTNPGGKIWVNIYSDDEFVKISVKDNGIGISKEYQEAIFERFVQEDKSLRRGNEGSGIGLSLVKSLLEGIDGDIKLNSDGKTGSEFIIILKNEFCEECDLKSNYHFDDEKIKLEFSDIYEIYGESVSV